MPLYCVRNAREVFAFVTVQGIDKMFKRERFFHVHSLPYLWLNRPFVCQAEKCILLVKPAKLPKCRPDVLYVEMAKWSKGAHSIALRNSSILFFFCVCVSGCIHVTALHPVSVTRVALGAM